MEWFLGRVLEKWFSAGYVVRQEFQHKKIRTGCKHGVRVMFLCWSGGVVTVGG